MQYLMKIIKKKIVRNYKLLKNLFIYLSKKSKNSNIQRLQKISKMKK